MRASRSVVYRDGGKQTGLRFLDDGERLQIGRGGGGGRLVGDFDLRLETIELWILEHQPPGAAVAIIKRRRAFPAFELLVCSGYRRRRAQIIRSHRAAKELQAQNSGRNTRPSFRSALELWPHGIQLLRTSRLEGQVCANGDVRPLLYIVNELWLINQPMWQD